MPNLAIHIKGSDDINQFVIECVKDGQNYSGDNISISGAKNYLFDALWTCDVATYDPETNTWDKKVSELTPCDPGAEINKTSKKDFEKAIIRRKELANMTYSQVESYINNNVIDLASAKQYLIKLSKIVLAGIKIQDR